MLSLLIFFKHPILVIPVTFLMVAGFKVSRLRWILDIDMHIITKKDMSHCTVKSQYKISTNKWLAEYWIVATVPVFVYYVLVLSAQAKRGWSILVFACNYQLKVRILLPSDQNLFIKCKVLSTRENIYLTKKILFDCLKQRFGLFQLL